MGNRISYSGSKAAITMMTKAMALELAEYGIAVNMVVPGIVDGKMALERLNTQEIRSEYEQYISLGRLATPKDVSGSVLFMAFPYASYITGTVLLVDGGLLIRQSMPK
jgi:NAD(P)-dependent dehydrogenase (short-subunit alcohol dehydrogenase family)